MTDKNELIHNVKNWITIDNEIKELQKIMKEKRISFLLCEACGAKSTVKGKYA